MMETSSANFQRQLSEIRMVNKFENVNIESTKICTTIRISPWIFLFLPIPLQGGALEAVILSASFSFSFRENVIFLLHVHFLRTHVAIGLSYLFSFKTLKSSTKHLLLFYHVMNFYSCAHCANYIVILTLAGLSPLAISTTHRPLHPQGSLTILLYLLYGTFHYLKLRSLFICLYVVLVNKILLVHYVRDSVIGTGDRNTGTEPMCVPLRRQTVINIDNNIYLSL